MPCSALKLPPMAATRSWMARLQGRFARAEWRRVRPGALADVEVQVAVTGVTVGNEEAFGHQLCGQSRAALDQFRHRSHGHADVVLEAAAGAALCFRERFRAGARNSRAVPRIGRWRRPAPRRLRWPRPAHRSSRASRSSLAGAGQLHQQVPGRARRLPGSRAPAHVQAPAPGRPAGSARSSTPGRRWHRATGPAVRSQRPDPAR